MNMLDRLVTERGEGRQGTEKPTPHNNPCIVGQAGRLMIENANQQTAEDVDCQSSKRKISTQESVDDRGQAISRECAGSSRQGNQYQDARSQETLHGYHRIIGATVNRSALARLPLKKRGRLVIHLNLRQGFPQRLGPSPGYLGGLDVQVFEILEFG